MATPMIPQRRCASCSAALPPGVLSCPTCGTDAPTEISPAETVAFSLPDDGRAGRRAAVQGAVGEEFEVRRLLGRGGFGEVWEAFDLRLGRTVAVKVLREDLAASAAYRERFRRETRAVAKLRHPGILPIYHVGEEDGLVYFIMPLVEGTTLKVALEPEGRLSVAEAVRILSEASDALREAHRRGIVHRDLKPENIMLEGAERRILLMDFGIAQSEEGGRELTGAGLVLGSPEYMSPEQAMGTTHLDGRSDIYSLGVVGYRMLAGRLPFVSETAREAVAHHVSTPPEPLEAVVEVPPGVAAAVMRCLEKRPGDRFQTTDELLAALRPTVRFASSPSLPAPAYSPVTGTPQAPPTAPARPRPARRALLWSVALVGLFVALWAAQRWSARRHWGDVAASVERLYGQVADSLGVLATGFRSGALAGPEYLAAAEGLQDAADARVTESFGPILDDHGSLPEGPRGRVVAALHAAWSAALPGAALTPQEAGAAGCVTRRERGTQVLEDSSSLDNCWWRVSPAPPMAAPLEYVLTFRVPVALRPDAGAGLAWCPTAATCRVIFAWSGGLVESAGYAPRAGLRQREVVGRVPPLSGEQHLRVRVEAGRVHVWLGDALVMERASAAEALALTRAGSVRVVVQNAAIAVGPDALIVVGARP